MRQAALGAALGAVLVFSAASPAAAQRPTGAHASAIQDSVLKLLADSRRLGAAGQWDSLAALYDDSPEFRWVEGGELRYRSTADIRKGLAALPPGVRIVTTHDQTEIQPLAPGLASVNTHFATTFGTAAGTGPAVSFSGMITMTVVHRPGGWRMLNGHTSTPPVTGR